MDSKVFVSDLHLGLGNHPTEDFFSDALFARLLASPPLNPRAGDTVELVLLGDVLDFWQVPLDDAEFTADDASSIRLEYSPADEVRRLERVHAAHPRWFQALGEWADRGAGRRLVFVPGNHDRTMLLPATQEAFLRATRTTNVRFQSYVLDPALKIYAEHGCQSDENNAYDAFSQVDWLTESAGYYFVKLFWNRLETLDPEIDESPGGWRNVWFYLRRVSRPRLFASAIKFWVQYRRDPRVPVRIALGSSSVADGAPDLLAAKQMDNGHVFSRDPGMEDAFRQAYYTSAEVRAVVEPLLAPGVLVPMPRQANALLEHLPGVADLAGTEDVAAASALFAQKLPQNAVAPAPLDPGAIASVIFGHTHQALVQPLNPPVGVTYLNTGTWIGRKAVAMPVAFADSNGVTQRPFR